MIAFITVALNTEECKALQSNETIYVDDDNVEGPWDGTKNNPYPTIQDGINAADNGIKNVYVKSGTYNENVIVNKSISLIGQNKSTTIIDASSEGKTVHVKREHVKITGFKIRKSGDSSKDAGVYISSRYANISNNNITGNQYGCYISSSNNMIYGNIIIENYKGIRSPAISNIITRNIIKNNSVGVYFCCASQNNLVYKNDFIGNEDKNGEDNSNGNRWNTTEVGNYWDDYKGNDTNGDGIGDTPYIVDAYDNSNDSYPLINSINFEPSDNPKKNNSDNGNQNNTNNSGNKKGSNSNDGFLLPGFEIMIVFLCLSLLIFVKKIKDKF